MLKQILSYIYPITKKIQSKYNGVLELTWYNGYKVLNTKNTNYSYGSLQEILDFALSKIAFDNVDKVLLLGMGGGSVIKTLRNKYHYKGLIKAVEYDEVIVEIACKEYAICTDDLLQIITADAFEFVANDTGKYDLIIIDLFQDNKVPKQFFSKEFIENIKPLVTNNAYFIFNLAMQDSALDIVSLKNYFGTMFNLQLFEKVLGTNTLLIGKKL